MILSLVDRPEASSPPSSPASATTSPVVDLVSSDFLLNFDHSPVHSPTLYHGSVVGINVNNDNNSSNDGSAPTSTPGISEGVPIPPDTSALTAPYLTEDLLSTFFDIDHLLSDYSPASQLSDYSSLYTATNTCVNSPDLGTVIVGAPGFDESPLLHALGPECDSFATWESNYHNNCTTTASTTRAITTSPETSTSPLLTVTDSPPFDGFSFASADGLPIPSPSNGYSPLDTHDMGMVDVNDRFSDFELYAPDSVLIPSSSTHHRQQHNHQRGATTSTSTSVPSSNRSLFSPALSAGDESPSLNLTSGTTRSTNPTSISRKRASPSDDHLPSPPPSTKTQKVSTTTSVVYSASSILASAPRSQRSQSPSLVLATAEDTVAIKRARNTLAARRYRQKRIERLEELEALLIEAEKEKERWRQEAMSWRMESEKWKGRYEGAVVGGGGTVASNTNHTSTGQQSGRK